MEIDVYKRHNENYENHWWFEGKKNIFYSILKKNINKNNLKILDFGCGVGINTKMLSNFGDVTCFDQSPEAIKYLKKRFNNNNKIFIEDNLENCEKLFDLSENQFNPPPKVKSSVIALKKSFNLEQVRNV